MDRPGKGFLAGARLTDDQHGQAVAGRFGGDGKGCAEIWSGPDQLFELKRVRELLRDRRELTGGAAAVGIGCERLQKPLGRDGTHQEVGSACAHRFYGHRYGIAVRQNNDRQIRTMLTQRGDELGALFGIPATEQRGEDLAAVRALKQGKRHFLIGGADHAPAGTARDRGNQPAFLRIGVQQQQRTCRFFTHARGFIGPKR